MPRNLELPPEVARAFHAEKNGVKADGIAARQLHALRAYQRQGEKKRRNRASRT